MPVSSRLTVVAKTNTRKAFNGSGALMTGSTRNCGCVSKHSVGVNLNSSHLNSKPYVYRGEQYLKRCRCVQACYVLHWFSVRFLFFYFFVFWLHLAKTWLWENLETLLPAHLVSLHNALIRPSGSDDNNNLSHLHDSVSPLNLSPLHALLSLSSTSPHLFRPPFFFLSSCL